jgi:hypothetical protein
MPARVIIVFYPRQPFAPFLGLITCKTPQIHPECAVYHFGLSIYLGVICQIEIKAGALKVKEFLLELACEGRIPIAHNGLGHAKKFKNIFKEYLNYTHRRVWMTDGQEMGIFRQSVHNYKNS